MQPMNSPGDIAANMPNASMMFQTYTPTFGNLGFQIMPSQTGEVSNTYGTIPYFGLEGLIYMQQMQAQTAPQNILPGQNTGQQNVQGAITSVDGTGNMRFAISGGASKGNNSAIGQF